MIDKITLEDVAHQHSPIIPTSEQWNPEMLERFIQKYCMNCPVKFEGDVCRTKLSLITAHESHRTHFTMDGPLYVNTKKDEVRCSLHDGYCEI